MADDPLITLERELLAAAGRQSATLGGRHWRTSFGGMLTVAAALLAAIVAAGAALLLGGHAGHGGRVGARPGTGPTRTDASTHAPVPLAIEPSVYALVDQHPGNGAGPMQPTFRQVDGVARQLGFARYNTFAYTSNTLTVPGGLKLSLWEIAVKPAGRPEQDVIAAVINGYVIAKRTAAQMADRGLTVLYGNAGPPRIAVIVPNQVHAVSIASSRVVPARATVHDNLAAFRITGTAAVGPSILSRITWYGRDGRVLALVNR